MRWALGWRSLLVGAWLNILIQGNVDCAGDCALRYGFAQAMPSARKLELRERARDMIHHAYDSYLDFGFPADEVRPMTCEPLMRDRNDPANLPLNDVLGNYSVTLVDSLSTLAILASSSLEDLHRFHEGVDSMASQYNDSSRGLGFFDNDSKVQVFETVIRGIGGLLSAHLFSTGDLEIKSPRHYFRQRRLPQLPTPEEENEIREWEITHLLWTSKYRQTQPLLLLAHDLGNRLLPAFETRTGIPLPRVNLKTGRVPSHGGQTLPNGQEETTETCAAGAGSLVLEFTVLSRLTGDSRFERLARTAFYAIWKRKSAKFGLVGSGIDAESGKWENSAISGIGAGIDSFFEYALKGHLLLATGDPRDEQTSEQYLQVWNEATESIMRHMLSTSPAAHLVNVHPNSGAVVTPWIDSLSFFFNSLLTLAPMAKDDGYHKDLASSLHLFPTAIWTRYSGLPERFSLGQGGADAALHWYPLRPEFIESTYHLYRQTKDPWYLYIGEMVMQDIERRCWVACGYSGLQNVVSGEKVDRMESFFLSETLSYLFLLFDEHHPLHQLLEGDGNGGGVVFSTEGHPLRIPKRFRGLGPKEPKRRQKKVSRTKLKKTKPAVNVRARTVPVVQDSRVTSSPMQCPNPTIRSPNTQLFSQMASRSDIFHVIFLAQLGPHSRKIPEWQEPNADPSEIWYPPAPFRGPYFPSTLPTYLIPPNATCDVMPTFETFEIIFPSSGLGEKLPEGQRLNESGAANNSPWTQQNQLSRVDGGLVINSLLSLRIGLIRDVELGSPRDMAKSYRIHRVGGLSLGREEKVWMKRDLLDYLRDPNFKVERDAVLDLFLEFDHSGDRTAHEQQQSTQRNTMQEVMARLNAHFESNPSTNGSPALDGTNSMQDLISRVAQQLAGGFAGTGQSMDKIPAILSAGIGMPELSFEDSNSGLPKLPLLSAIFGDLNSRPESPIWKSVFVGDDACAGELPSLAGRSDIVVLKRGGCPFVDKLNNIPEVRYNPSTSSAGSSYVGPKLVIIVDYHDERVNSETDAESVLYSDTFSTQPLIDLPQKRKRPIPMVMVSGGDKAYGMFERAKGVGLKFRWHVDIQGVGISNLVVVP